MWKIVLGEVSVEVESVFGHTAWLIKLQQVTMATVGMTTGEHVVFLSKEVQLSEFCIIFCI